MQEELYNSISLYEIYMKYVCMHYAYLQYITIRIIIVIELFFLLLNNETTKNKQTVID